MALRYWADKLLGSGYLVRIRAKSGTMADVAMLALASSGAPELCCVDRAGCCRWRQKYGARGANENSDQLDLGFARPVRSCVECASRWYPAAISSISRFASGCVSRVASEYASRARSSQYSSVGGLDGTCGDPPVPGKTAV